MSFFRRLFGRAGLESFEAGAPLDDELGVADYQATAGFAAVVGDASAAAVLKQLDTIGIRTSSTLEGQANASLLIIVQDSTIGPTAVHHRIAKELVNRPTDGYLWIFTNSAMVDDQQLLELEELEAREILNSQGLPGDDIMFAFDSPSAQVPRDYSCPKGWKEIAKHIRSIVS